MARFLHVWLNGDCVGELQQDDNGQLRFRYLEEWLSQAEAAPLSFSLPLQKEAFPQRQARPFFAGLLPEETNRDLISKMLGVSLPIAMTGTQSVRKSETRLTTENHSLTRILECAEAIGWTIVSREEAEHRRASSPQGDAHTSGNSLIQSRYGTGSGIIYEIPRCLAFAQRARAK